MTYCRPARQTGSRCVLKLLTGAQSQQKAEEQMQSTDLRGDRDLDRDEETERDRFLNSATSVSETWLIVMAFLGSYMAIHMGEYYIACNDSIRVWQESHLVQLYR